MMMTTHILEATSRRRRRPTSSTWLMAIQTLSKCIDLTDQPEGRIIKTRAAMEAVAAAQTMKTTVKRVEKKMKVLTMRQKLALAIE